MRYGLYLELTFTTFTEKLALYTLYSTRDTERINERIEMSK